MVEDHVHCALGEFFSRGGEDPCRNLFGGCAHKFLDHNDLLNLCKLVVDDLVQNLEQLGGVHLC